MQAKETECEECKKYITLRIRIINCDLCKHFFHVKCCGLNHKIYNSIKATNTWLCKHCVRINSTGTEKDELN